MNDDDGLIIQSCGGDLQEWVDGINDMLTKAGVLLNGTRFKDVSTFKYGGRTCLLFPFEGVDLNIGRFAVWRLQTHDTLQGTWLSDFVPNRLGGFVVDSPPKQEKPDCPLIGQDGNIFNLMGIASRTLRENDMADQAKEMSDRIQASGSYNEALRIISEYVNITSIDDDESLSGEDGECEGMGGISM